MTSVLVKISEFIDKNRVMICIGVVGYYILMLVNAATISKPIANVLSPMQRMVGVVLVASLLAAATAFVLYSLIVDLIAVRRGVILAKSESGNVEQGLLSDLLAKIEILEQLNKNKAAEMREWLDLLEKAKLEIDTSDHARYGAYLNRRVRFADALDAAVEYCQSAEYRAKTTYNPY